MNFVQTIILFFCVFTVGTRIASAQQCLTNEKTQEALEKHPELQKQRQNFLKQSEAFLSRKNDLNQLQDSVVYTIPVVVHVIYNNDRQNISNEQIDSQLDILNQDFRRFNPDSIVTPNRFKAVAADAGLEFCLAEIDPNGEPTTGITRTETAVSEIGSTEKYYISSEGGKTIWNPDRYLNIYVCEIGNDILGFTYLPGSALPDRDAVVIDYRNFGVTGTALAPFDRGRTTTHEVGHWLNLEHTWGPTNESCDQDDGVADTPLQFTSNTNCPSSPNFSCDNAPLGDMHMNFMEYTVDRCQNLFTLGQKERMRAAIIQFRPGILFSDVCGTRNQDVTSTVVFDAYPNPSGDRFTIRVRLPAESQNATIGIYTLQGALVKRWTFDTLLAENISLNTSELGSGVFVAQLTFNAEIHTFKLVSVSDL